MSTKKFKHAPLPRPKAIKKKATPAKIKVPRPVLNEPVKPKKPTIKAKKLYNHQVPGFNDDELSKKFYSLVGATVIENTYTWGTEWELEKNPDKKYIDDCYWTSAGIAKLAEFMAQEEATLPGIEGTKKLSVQMDYDLINWHYETELYPSAEEIHNQNKRYEEALDRYEKALEAYNHPVSIAARKKRDEKEAVKIKAKVDKLKKAQEELEKKLKKAS